MPDSNAELRTAEYRRWRARYLVAHPLCVACVGNGRTVAAQELDHIRRREWGGALMDPENVQGLCRAHHRRKSDWESNGQGFPTRSGDLIEWDGPLDA